MKLKLALLSVIFAGVSFLFFQVFIDDNTTAISTEEAEAIAAGLYDGKVIKSKEDKKGNYTISIENEKGIYQLTVNGHTKKVSNVKRLKEKKQHFMALDAAEKNIQQEFKGNVLSIRKSGDAVANAQVKKKNRTYQIIYDLKEGKIISSKVVKSSKKSTGDKEKNMRISMGQLTNIAKNQLDGNVSNIKKLNTDHGIVYKVTVEKRTEGAHVYVQEATKKATSVSWFSKNAGDDDDDLDDDDGSNEADDNDDHDMDDISED
ncbi:PepSY domain-containing protein [Virgibacillus siamensis]|uniref:PepSY domain-containing protein n=1 Tax=Virgibacillus siamensis TaxID=480071 RepID=UPI000984D1BA|nr:PepSY domain-containing protein [Virgibacillus siamensis]